MTDLVIHNLDPSVIARLEAKAKEKGRSLQQEAKDILERAVPMTLTPMTVAELDTRFKEIDATFTQGKISISIEDLIREEREARGG